MLQTAVVGARGYLGRVCTRLLVDHPEVAQVVPVSLSSAQGHLGDSVAGFAGVPGLEMRSIDDPAVTGADVVFLATAGGQARELIERWPADGPLVIDLSRDHRIEALDAVMQGVAMANGGEGATSGSTVTATAGSSWTYAVPDLPGTDIRSSKRIANPGCYPTATLLGLAPALENGLADDGVIIADGKSGTSGAGATPRADLHFAETNESIRAYKVVGHDHEEEIRLAVRNIESAQPGSAGHVRPVKFTPHLVPLNRGLLVTAYVPLKPGVTQDDVDQAYASYYAGSRTVRVVDEPNTKHVRDTVRAEVAADVDETSRLLVVRCAIDNLVKGGSGQAIHNMNVALGFDPLLGLPTIGGGI